VISRDYRVGYEGILDEGIVQNCEEDGQVGRAVCAKNRALSFEHGKEGFVERWKEN